MERKKEQRRKKDCGSTKRERERKKKDRKKKDRKKKTIRRT